MAGELRRVLVIDDEPLVARTTARMLREFAVTVVASAEDAVRLFETGERFDCVLLDLHLEGGGMQGPDLFAWAQEKDDPHFSRIVLFSGGSCNAEDEAFLALVERSHPVVLRPTRAATLRGVVEQVIARG
jgi:CheY-like chemotaxis protein